MHLLQAFFCELDVWLWLGLLGDYLQVDAVLRLVLALTLNLTLTLNVTTFTVSVRFRARVNVNVNSGYS